MAILGQNGAGKTTTTNILVGNCYATSGEAYLYGCSLTDDREKLRSMRGVCPQVCI